KQACRIEIYRCKKPIGKQDQYAAAFGGLNYIQFNPDGSVMINPIICQKKTIEKLKQNLLLLYTGLTRSSSSILEEQNQKTRASSKKRKILSLMVKLAKELKNSLEKNSLDRFGELLHQNWQLKKQMANGITNAEIDQWYNLARKNGAVGGKILGAGGGGFLLLYAPKEKQEQIKAALSKLKNTPFSFEPEGSKIIYFGER
ncbi:GHMP kinase, partial [Patescibacteria group bacterium]|nr:GHMP kinase [Patescibacteria group bacterium]